MQFFKFWQRSIAPVPFVDFPNTPQHTPKEAVMPKETTILVDRNLSNRNATLSDVYINGKLICHSLEDEHRAKKVWGETRIPAGRYQITLRTHGGFHNHYSTAGWSKGFHCGMLWVRNVPNFESILIHVGNTEKDTAGCLLVGMNRDDRSMTIQLSRMAYKKFYALVVDAAAAETLWVEYKDNDGV
jgi:hypothetical protein